jgi:hypothetical protein
LLDIIIETPIRYSDLAMEPREKTRRKGSRKGK